MEARYARQARILHWTIATMVAVAVVLGLLAVSYERGHPTRDLLMLFHRPLGVVVLALSMVRVSWGWYRRAPPLPASIRAVERGLAHLVHAMLCIVLIAMPLSGALLTQAAGHQISFVFFSVPQLIAFDPAVPIPERPLVRLGYLLHKQVFPPLLYGLVTIHVLGFLKHVALDRDLAVWRRIWG